MRLHNLSQDKTYIKKHCASKHWPKALMLLCAAAVFCATYALARPAIAMERTCQIPEHTHTNMSGYLKLEPSGLENDLTDVTVTLTIPKQYVEKDSVRIPEFNTNSSSTVYEILPVEEDETNYYARIHFTTYDKTQTLVLPFCSVFWMTCCRITTGCPSPRRSPAEVRPSPTSIRRNIKSGKS